MRHPMPCPGCRRIIDATDRLCPHCGVDTDAKLAPLRTVLVLFVVLLAVGGGLAIGGVDVRVLAAVGLGAVIAFLVVRRRKRR
jgi:hypothetical protein